MKTSVKPSKAKLTSKIIVFTFEEVYLGTINIE
jgi:hypothetical protein